MQKHPPKSAENSTHKHLIEALKSNDSIVIKKLYADNFFKIESFVLKNSGTSQDAKDVFQEAFIALWKKVKENSFEKQNESGINGFLYSVARNKWLDHLRSATHKNKVQLNSKNELHIETENTEEVDSGYETKRQSALAAFENLGDSCKTLLTKFYFEKKSLNEIAAELVLDSASARNKKYRCMQKLRELTLENE